jgi:hypothetical protein
VGFGDVSKYPMFIVGEEGGAMMQSEEILTFDVIALRYQDDKETMGAHSGNNQASVAS